jgi:hypothetical protein
MTRKFFTMILAAGMLVVASSGIAQVPELINYQGYLTDVNGKPVQDGTYTITFKIYDAETGGNALWEETQQVRIDDGMFHVLLGSINPVKSSIFTGANRWLGITVGNDNEIAPRSRLVSVPYAMSADSLGGGAVNVDNNGNVCIGTTRPNRKLDVAGDIRLSNTDYGTRLVIRRTSPSEPWSPVGINPGAFVIDM